MSSIIGGIKMEYPIIVGGGVCKTPASILPYMKPNLAIGVVETGSYTPSQRDGNQGTLAWPTDYQEFLEAQFGLNSYGMPNCCFNEALSIFQKQYLQHLKPVLVNIAGFSVEDYLEGANTFGRNPEIFAGIVANAGCPNAHDGKTIPIAYDLDTCDRILDAIGGLDLQVPFWWKESPTITRNQLSQLEQHLPHVDFSHTPVVDDAFLYEKAELLKQYPFIRAVIYSNTLGNCIYRDAKGKTVTTPNDGKAGLSGSVMKDISSVLIQFMRPLLPDTIDLIHSGGILTGEDVVDCLSWAKAVQCTSGPFWYGDGPRFFANLISESETLQEHLFKDLI